MFLEVNLGEGRTSPSLRCTSASIYLVERSTFLDLYEDTSFTMSSFAVEDRI